MRAQALQTLSQYLGMMNLPPIVSSISSGLAEFYTTWAPTLEVLLNHRDRPIGVSAFNGQTRFAPRMLKLDFENVEGLLAAGALSSAGTGTFEVRYKDEVTGGNGDYSIILRIERMN